MDWSKAKNILIVALIITNILLCIDIIVIKDEMELFDDKALKDTINILNEKDIYVYTEIATEQVYMPVLEVKYDEITDDFINEAIKNQEEITYPGISKEKTIEKVETFLNDNGLADEDMKLEEPIKEDGNKYILTYRKYYNHIALEECHMVITVEEGVIINIDRIWLNAINQGKMTKRTIPVTTALLKFASTLPEDIDRPIIITDIEMSYWLKTSAHDKEITMKDTALPAWKISYNKDVEYILAYEN